MPTDSSKMDILVILLLTVARLIPGVLTRDGGEESTPRKPTLGIVMLLVLALLAVLLVLV